MSERYIGLMPGTRIRYGIEAALSQVLFPDLQVRKPMTERYIGLMSGTRIRHGIEAASSLTYFFPTCK